LSRDGQEILTGRVRLPAVNLIKQVLWYSAKIILQKSHTFVTEIKPALFTRMMTSAQGLPTAVRRSSNDGVVKRAVADKWQGGYAIKWRRHEVIAILFTGCGGCAYCSL
jgi:hypothetical protein